MLKTDPKIFIIASSISINDLEAIVMDFELSC